jgi:hypothetical protein
MVFIFSLLRWNFGNYRARSLDLNVHFYSWGGIHAENLLLLKDKNEDAPPQHRSDGFFHRNTNIDWQASA